MYIFQERLVFKATRLDGDYEFLFDQDFDELNLEMDDGAVLNSLHFKVENPKGLILYFHGNAGDLSKWGEIVQPFTKYGHEVLVVDYRGYGKSSGRRSKQKMLKDAETVYAHAASMYDQSKITVYGRSMGGAFACHVASLFSPGQLILESPFASVADVARTFAWMYPLKYMMRFNFDNTKPISVVKCPINIFHGTGDYVVPISSGRKLSWFNEEAVFTEIPNAGHNDISDYKAYWDGIEEILD